MSEIQTIKKIDRKVDRSVFKQQIENYLKTYGTSYKTQKTIKYYITNFKRFLKTKGMKSFFDVNQNDMDEYFNHLNVSKEYSLGYKSNMFDAVRKFIKKLFRCQIFDKIDVDLNKDYDQKEMFKIIIRFVQQQEKRNEIDNLINYISNHSNFTWSGPQNHKAGRDTSYTLTKKELKEILEYYEFYDSEKHVIFRILTETGMRIGEVISLNHERNLDIKNGQLTRINTPIPIIDDIKERKLFVNGKKGYAFYPISIRLRELLLEFMTNSIFQDVEDSNGKALFCSNRRRRYTTNTFNYSLNNTLERIQLDHKPITPHTFRRTINKLRERMGADKTTRKILVNHKLNDVNEDSYTPHEWVEILEFYDQYNPYENLEL